jgi:polyribonucleotide nucleotidyltransferase
MRKLFAGLAVVLMMSQSSYAVDDQRILEVIKAGISDIKSLCEKLNTLPEEDKKRLANLSYGEPNGPAQEEIVKIMDKHLSLLNCISNLNSKPMGW